MNIKDAKIWSKEDKDRDWHDQWKHGDIVRSVTVKGGKLTFNWGSKATQAQKDLIEDCISKPSKWAAQVEDLLDNPPDAATRRMLKELKRFGR